MSHGAGKVSHGARKVSHGVRKVSHGVRNVSYGVMKVSHGASKVSHSDREVAHCARKLSNGARKVSFDCLLSTTLLLQLHNFADEYVLVCCHPTSQNLDVPYKTGGAMTMALPFRPKAMGKKLITKY